MRFENREGDKHPIIRAGYVVLSETRRRYTLPYRVRRVKKGQGSWGMGSGRMGEEGH